MQGEILWKIEAQRPRFDEALEKSNRESATKVADLQNQRDDLSRKLEDSQNSLASLGQQIDTLRHGREADLLRATTLETRVSDLSARLHDVESSSEREHDLLAADSDIRELMGARDLYIADVFDIDLQGKAQKPFGRVFYTKEKSLIFYAFDLDQTPGLRNASASSFQVWGRLESNHQRALSMGALYLDNATHKRRALKFDNPQALRQIDAVYVTVEPKGASDKPRGKQLLFAFLRSQPHHP